jgi:hypothetical protein
VPASAVDAAHDFGNRHRHHQPERATPPAPDLHAVV